jgi:hypothetical protein
MTLAAPRPHVAPALRVDPTFAEAVVWRVLSAADTRTAEALTAHRRRSEAVYGIDDPVARDAAFSELAVREFERLGLAEPLRRAIAERPAVADRVRIILVGDARGRSEEGITWEPGGVHLGIRLDGAQFGDHDDLLAWARHALGHAEDTIDPSFGFTPGWEETAEGRIASGTQARLHRLWDVTVDSRLATVGLLLDATAPQRHSERIAADLPGVTAESVDAVFGFLWDGPRPTFARLLAWAARPFELVAAACPDVPGLPRPDRCPLCRFPSDDVVPPPNAIATLVTTDYPEWHSGLGLCGRCTDRYRFAGRLGGAA